MADPRATLARLGRRLPPRVKRVARPVAERLGIVAPVRHWWQTDLPPWAAPTPEELAAPTRCNICRWSGDAFEGGAHSEFARCPRCGSIARDRFLLWCFLHRHPDPSGARVLETSPRLGDDYRGFMRRWFDYRTSDYDQSAHRGDLVLDLQDIDLPSASLDVVVSPHVLEHVPDTGRALSELHRVLAPGGRLYLQVPLLQGRTGVPAEPEFHGDNTPVFFRFGWDLTDALRSAGFDVDVLVTEPWRQALASATVPDGDGGEFDTASLVEHVRPDDLEAVADSATAAQLGFLPLHHFATWECRRQT